MNQHLTRSRLYSRFNPSSPSFDISLVAAISVYGFAIFSAILIYSFAPSF